MFSAEARKFITTPNADICNKKPTCVLSVVCVFAVFALRLDALFRWLSEAEQLGEQPVPSNRSFGRAIRPLI
jgi:hypothetical protein